MTMVGGFHGHRKQIMFDYVDDDGLVRWGQIRPATLKTLRAWLGEHCPGGDAEFALEGCTGWWYVVEELAAAGVGAHLGDPAEIAVARGVRRSAPKPTAPTRGCCAPCCWRAGPFGGAWDHWTERGVTARSLDHIWSLPADILARLGHGVGRDAKPLALLDETVALRRCALYRDGFKGTAVGYHARLLGFGALAEWIRRHGVTVDVTSPADLYQALAAGIDPMHMVMHSGDAASIRRGVNAGAARFVVGSSLQIANMAASAERVQHVVVDATDHAGGALASDVLTHPELDLIGLHCNLDDPDDAIGAVKLRQMVAEMSRIRRAHNVLLTRVSLAGLDVGEHWLEPRILRRVAEAIGEVIGDACARHRYPRPALTVSPSRAALLPA